MPVAPQRIVVTGGAGFLGSHLCKLLLSQGHEVLCVDNFFTSSRRGVEHLLDNKRFELLRHDVTMPLHVEADAIYNLACPASPVHYQHDPVQTTKTSVIGAINMLELAKRLRAKVLQASTSEVYGDPIVHPQTEAYWGNVNPIGPRMHPNDGRVVSNFIMQALRGDDITLFGDGEQTRSFCYVSDLIDGLHRMMSTPDSVVGPINLGNPEECTVRALAETIIGLTGSRSTLVRRPLPPDDPRQRQPDITKARDVLGWEPTVSMQLGLTSTIAYFDTLLASGEVPELIGGAGLASAARP